MRSILSKVHSDLFKSCFVLRSCVVLKEEILAGLHHTEVRIGDAPKPQFSFKSIDKSTKSGNHSSSTINKIPSFWISHVNNVSGQPCLGKSWWALVGEVMAGKVLQSLQRQPAINITFTGCRLCRRPPKPDDLMFWWVLIENEGFGASPIRTSVWCSPAGAFFYRKKCLSLKNIFFKDVQLFLGK